MSKDEYGRGPVLQVVDNAVAFIRWDWVAEFVFIVSAYALVRIIADSDHETWVKSLGLFSLMFVAGMAYLSGTHDRGAYSKRDKDDA